MIVVIAILAAITIVAYNGIQQRAHTTSQKTTAENLAKKIEGFNAINNAYPTLPGTTTVTNQLAADASTSLSGAGITINTAAQASGVSDSTVELDLCSNSATVLAANAAASGYIIYIYDQTKGMRDAVQAGGNVTLTVNNSGANTVNYTSPVVAGSCTRANG